MSLSSGGVYSFHGEFIAAWDSRMEQGLVAHCLNTATAPCHVIQVAPNGDVTINGGTKIFNLSDYSASPTPTPTGTPNAPPGDTNGDGKVNILDLSSLLSAWGTSTTADDLNHDGIVNVTDLSVLLSHWTG
jgi:hypothetical protein